MTYFGREEVEWIVRFEVMLVIGCQVCVFDLKKLDKIAEFCGDRIDLDLSAVLLLYCVSVWGLIEFLKILFGSEDCLAYWGRTWKCGGT